MSKLKRYEKDGETVIKSIFVTNATLSYPYLFAPRTEGFGKGEYGAELIIHDKETAALVKEYLGETVKKDRSTVFKNKLQGLHYAVRNPKEDSELEEGAVLVVKTKSKGEYQPRLYIREEGKKRARELNEQEIREQAIVAGNLVDAEFRFVSYDYQGKRGISAYLNAVCKTGEGTPIIAKTDYEDEFSIGTEFDDEDEVVEEKDEEVDLSSFLPKKEEKKATATKPAAKASKKVETDVVDIDDLIATGVTETEDEPDEDSTVIDIEDLIA